MSRVIDDGLRRQVGLVAAALLEIHRRADFPKLDDIGAEPVGRTLGKDLASQRTVLRAHVVALNLGNVQGEGVDRAGRSGFAVLV